MTKELFQKWIPINNLASAYDVESIICGEIISFTLVADKKRKPENHIHRFQIVWNSSQIISYHVTDETYRSDCWNLAFENCGRLFTSKNSEYIEKLKEKSPLFPDNVIHFSIVGTNTIVDVLAKEYPVVKVLE